MEFNQGTNPSWSFCKHSLTKGLKSNTVVEIGAQTSPANAARCLQHCSHNPNQFTLNVYKAESKPLSRLMRWYRRKYETDIASNPKAFISHVRELLEKKVVNKMLSGGLNLHPSLFFSTKAAWLARSSVQSSAGS